MSKMIKTVSVCLCVMLLFITAVPGAGFGLLISAATSSVGYINATNVNIRTQPTTASASLGMVSNIYVTIHGKTKGTASGDTHMWYHITTSEDITGYIRDDLIVEIPDPEPDANFEESLKAFPSSYHKALRDLHAVYPNWVFKADKLSMSFDSAVTAESGFYPGEPLKLVNLTSDGISWRSMAKGVYNWNSGVWSSFAGGWTGAAKQVIAYYMDPRNFLNANDIYMFMQQSFDPTKQTEAGLQEVVRGTFLANGYSDSADTAYGGSYVKVIMEAARQSGVSPYVLASTIILEQGSGGTSQLISGTTSYGKYYNFFNFSASGSDVVKNGLTFAKEQGWSTRSASIIGGAKRYGGSYVSIGQDTYFYKDFNLGVASGHSAYTHQYAQSVYDARSSAKSMYKAYSNDKTTVLYFRIPVYTSIPDALASKPEENKLLNNHYILELSAQGLSPEFEMYTQSYNLSISGNTEISYKLPEGASLASQSSYNVPKGNSTVKIMVKAQTGYANTYTINVTASAAATISLKDAQKPPETENPSPETPKPDVSVPEPPSQDSEYKPGDTNNDGKINVIDLANVQKHIVKRAVLSGKSFSAGDTNNDGKINVIDLANIQKHIVGKAKLW